MDKEVYKRIRSNYRRIKSNYRRSGAITEGICASSGKRSKTEEEEREARK